MNVYSAVKGSKRSKPLKVSVNFGRNFWFQEIERFFYLPKAEYLINVLVSFPSAVHLTPEQNANFGNARD
jgi:hypothetical protein